MDTLYINGIRAYGHTGFLPEEQVLGQWFEVDLTIHLNLWTAGASDRLEDTYDYGLAVQAVHTLINTERFHLIERLAEAIAQTVLASGEIPLVTVRLTKLTPPIPHFSGTITVEITRPCHGQGG
jgi:7,8-dihydroneopterin aldolase/epimerase/oxygenase